jgi:Anion-transporting ATPase
VTVQDSVVMVKELFRNKEATEFVVATIPTMLAVNESERLLRSLRKDNIPCKRIVVNQVHGCSSSPLPPPPPPRSPPSQLHQPLVLAVCNAPLGLIDT